MAENIKPQGLEGTKRVGVGGSESAGKGKDSRENLDLKKLGIAFQEPDLIEKYYESLKALIIGGIMSSPTHGLILDLGALPSEPYPFKKIFIKWLIEVNLPRIKAGGEPIYPMSLIMQCPLWKVIKPPIRKLTLTPEGMFGVPSVKTVNRQTRAGRINKK